MRLILALQLMTRLPIKKQFNAQPEDYAGSVLWFFVVALLAGGVMAATYFIADLASVPYLAALCSVIAAYLFTGGLHIDGFADMCDAFLAHKDRVRTLEILKDSQMGVYGVIAIAFMVAAKTLLVGNLNINMLPVLLALPVCGKVAMVVCAGVSSYARQDGLGKYIIDYIKPGTAVLSIVICAVITIICCGFLAGGMVIAVSLMIGFCIAAVSKAKIGGATGDVLGAANELGELAYLIIMGVLF